MPAWSHPWQGMLHRRAVQRGGGLRSGSNKSNCKKNVGRGGLRKNCGNNCGAVTEPPESSRSTTSAQVGRNASVSLETLKLIVPQQSGAKAKGTNKHTRWRGKKQLQKNCRKLRKIAGKLRPSKPPPAPAAVASNGHCSAMMVRKKDIWSITRSRC